MSRYSSSGAYDKMISYAAWGGSDDFEISWTVDFYYPNSRLRHPRTYRRITDRAGALRFAKKWKVKMPCPARGPNGMRCRLGDGHQGDEHKAGVNTWKTAS